MNALCKPMIQEMTTALQQLDSDNKVGCIVLTGNERSFSAGSDIQGMQDKAYSHNIRENFVGYWDDWMKIKKPIIAAVNGKLRT